MWSRCRSSFEALGHTGDGELDNVGFAIAELHLMDPLGDAFRYPLSRDGIATLDGIDQLSFQRINDALIPVSNFLDTAETAISVELENKLDFEREYADAWY